MRDTEPLDLLVVNSLDDDVIECQDDKHIYIRLPGRYALLDGGERRLTRQFSCRAVSISPHEVAKKLKASSYAGEDAGRLRPLSIP